MLGRRSPRRILGRGTVSLRACSPCAGPSPFYHNGRRGDPRGPDRGSDNKARVPVNVARRVHATALTVRRYSSRVMFFCSYFETAPVNRFLAFCHSVVGGSYSRTVHKIGDIAVPGAGLQIAYGLADACVCLHTTTIYPSRVQIHPRWLLGAAAKISFISCSSIRTTPLTSGFPAARSKIRYLFGSTVMT